MSQPLGSQSWAEFVGNLNELGSVLFSSELPDSELHRTEGSRYALRFLAAGILDCVEYMDPYDPEFVPCIDPRMSWGLDNPDCNYALCGVDPSGSYRIWGSPGSALTFELQLNTGHFADGRATEWKSVSSVQGDRLNRGPDGSIEIWVSPEPPTPSDAPEPWAYWLQTEPQATHLFLRQYFGDWATEEPASLCVERLDLLLPPPALEQQEFGRRLDLLGLWLTAGARCWSEWGRALAQSDPGPVQAFLPPSNATGLTGQAYGMGGYACGPDQAVILELVPPTCAYWSVQLATWFWESAAVGSRQVSLNHTQAVTDEDGVVRFVIAQRDPGVANWLDPAGYEQGTLAVRFLWADQLPALSYRQVPFEHVQRELPPGTKVVTPEQRSQSLRSRRADLQRRLRR